MPATRPGHQDCTTPTDEAVRQATEQAKAADLGQLFVHGRDGKIQYEHTYGDDPRQRKG